MTEANGEKVERMEKIISTCREVIRRDRKNWAAYHDMGVALKIGRAHV